jgi:hypothetical protein
VKAELLDGAHAIANERVRSAGLTGNKLCKTA